MSEKDFNLQRNEPIFSWLENLFNYSSWTGKSNLTNEKKENNPVDEESKAIDSLVGMFQSSGIAPKSCDYHVEKTPEVVELDETYDFITKFLNSLDDLKKRELISKSTVDFSKSFLLELMDDYVSNLEDLGLKECLPPEYYLFESDFSLESSAELGALANSFFEQLRSRYFPNENDFKEDIVDSPKESSVLAKLDKQLSDHGFSPLQKALTYTSGLVGFVSPLVAGYYLLGGSGDSFLESSLTAAGSVFINLAPLFVGFPPLPLLTTTLTFGFASVGVMSYNVNKKSKQLFSEELAMEKLNKKIKAESEAIDSLIDMFRSSGITPKSRDYRVEKTPEVVELDETYVLIFTRIKALDYLIKENKFPDYVIIKFKDNLIESMHSYISRLEENGLSDFKIPPKEEFTKDLDKYCLTTVVASSFCFASKMRRGDIIFDTLTKNYFPNENDFENADDSLDVEYYSLD